MIHVSSSQRGRTDVKKKKCGHSKTTGCIGNWQVATLAGESRTREVTSQRVAALFVLLIESEVTFFVNG